MMINCFSWHKIIYQLWNQGHNFTPNHIAFSVKLKFTSMVWDWCMDLMADWAICLAVNVTNAQPERQKHSVSWFIQISLRKILFCQHLYCLYLIVNLDQSGFFMILAVFSGCGSHLLVPALDWGCCIRCTYYHIFLFYCSLFVRSLCALKHVGLSVSWFSLLHWDLTLAHVHAFRIQHNWICLVVLFGTWLQAVFLFNFIHYWPLAPQANANHWLH